MNHSVIIRTVRYRSPGRLDQTISAALRVFGEKGYRRTQMADVAREMGVSAGTLYNYVVSKEALFYLVVDRAFQEAPTTELPKFPVPTPSPGAIAQRLRERLRADVALPQLEAALERRLQNRVRQLKLATWPDGTVLGGPDRATGDPQTINEASAMYGTPDGIAKILDELRNVGVGYVLINGGGSGGGARGRESLRRFAREVMPMFAE